MPRSRAVAIALRRQQDPMPRLPWLALLAALIASLVAAHAQTPLRLDPSGGNVVQRAQVGPAPVERLDIPGAAESRANPDPSLLEAPPVIGGTMAVIPPPGMQGGNQPVITAGKPRSKL